MTKDSSRSENPKLNSEEIIRKLVEFPIEALEAALVVLADRTSKQGQ